MKIVIVGGGIIGTAVAARLGETDHDVTLLERSRIGSETTAASAGILMETAVAPTPFDLRFRTRARSVYRRLFDRGPLESDRVGTLYVAETTAFADRLEESVAVLREHDVEASFLSATEIARLGVDPDGFVGGLHTPNDSVCDPTDVANWFAARARRSGVDVRTGVRVTAVITRDGSVSGVETDEGRLQTDCVLNATGPWAPELNEMVGISLPLGHTLGPMVALEGPEPIESPVTILESKRYVRPTGGADGTGAWVGEYRTGYTEGQRYDPDQCTVSDEFRDTATDAASIVPALEGATAVDEWIGLRTVTPDGRPVVGETSVDGFVVACGMSGQGVTLAPAVADVVHDVLEGRVGDDHRRHLSPDRF
ncbi:NAD(P)/FAD-dependent oxidoreductase [Natrinema salaciae]|uniref:Glycine oxidase n=1 Tax=Natrinema salaciae TaxID=1186196 RepID=A0A1H9EPU4_9EURY|nr:FAD-dependent oxidoreductase [Natrinema salaciae]SEQ27607.1 glycine oxidase [Natrinema salaciae]